MRGPLAVGVGSDAHLIFCARRQTPHQKGGRALCTRP
ncbi:unnamed protein product [Ectocarpus sp. CCAP 1310/34]|nr:unnamed protein product [Ectocarpus sp. CCAP 1310/34]